MTTLFQQVPNGNNKNRQYKYNTLKFKGKTIDIYPFFFSTQGSIFKTHFYSHSLGNSRKLAVYLPPSYEENTYKRYPVILFQGISLFASFAVLMIISDGHNLFDTEDSFCGETWHLRESLDNLCCDRGIRECIVVGMYHILQLCVVIFHSNKIPNRARVGVFADLLFWEWYILILLSSFRYNAFCM